MNKKQKIVILLGVIALIAMIIYPPWIEYKPSGPGLGGVGILGDHYTSIGFHFIFDPPVKIGRKGYSLDKTRLTFQIAGLVLATFGICLVFSDKKKSVTDTSQ